METPTQAMKSFNDLRILSVRKAIRTILKRNRLLGLIANLNLLILSPFIKRKNIHRFLNNLEARKILQPRADLNLSVQRDALTAIREALERQADENDRRRLTQQVLELKMFKSSKSLKAKLACLIHARWPSRWSLALRLASRTTDPMIAKISARRFRDKGEIYTAFELLKIHDTISTDEIKPSEYLGEQIELLENGFPLPAIQTFEPIESRSSAPISVNYYLHNSLPFDSSGYATRAHGLAASIQRRGIDIECITRMGYPNDISSKESEERNWDTQKIDNVLYYRLATNEFAYNSTPIKKYLNAYCKIAEKDVLARGVPEVFQGASNFMNGIVANYLARIFNRPSVYEVRGLWEVTRISRQPEIAGTPLIEMLVRLENESCLNSTKVVAITHALKRELTQRGVPESKVSVIPNGVDSSRFKPFDPLETNALKLKHQLTDKFVIGYIGSLVDYEGLNLLIEALALLRGDQPKFADRIQVLIVGDGAELATLKDLVFQYELNQSIVFTGRVPHQQVEQYYGIMDLMVYPRKPMLVCEMVSPIKPLEAMAMRKAILVSSVDALSEMIIPNETGVIFEKGCVNSLAQAIVQLADDENFREKLGMNAREWVCTHRDWTILASQFQEIYQSCIDEFGKTQPTR